MRTKKTRKHQILSFFLAVLMIFTMLPVTAFAAGNVVYTNGVEGSGWPYNKAYINTITVGGAEVKRYTWTSSDICNVELVADTAADAEITVSITKSGTFASRMSAKLNGVGISDSGTIQLVDGKLENVPLYVDGVFKKATKTFNFVVAEENKLPTLADSSVTGEDATVVGTEGYQINLKNLFTDADAADTLTYLVSVNGAEAVNAPVDEEGIYTYETKFAGTYVLVFTAKDSKGDSSTDTYTTTLTVENSKNTYEMTVALPSDVTPVFYANAGFGDDGIPVNGEVLVSRAGEVSEEILTYTIQVPENVSEINVCTETYGGMSVQVSENLALTMRKVQMLTEDLFGAPVSAAVKVTYGENHTAIGAENQYLLLTGENYTFTTTPKDTKNFKTAVSSKVLESGTDNAVISALVDYQNLKTITAPMGAEVQLYRYNQYYDNTQIQLRGTKDNGNGTGTSYFAGADGAGIIYRVKYEDYILKAGYTNGNKTITFSENDLKEDVRVDYTQSKETNAGFTDDGVLLNVNRQNYLAMSKGTSKTLKAYRAWEIIPVSYNNWILEPDFRFTVVWESEDGVISLSDKPNNMTGGDSWKTLKAEKEGTAIIEVTYDAADVRGGNYDGVYNATDPARTGLVVVQVGGSTANVNFGIDGKASMGNVVYEKSTPKAWDAEFDTLYFTEEFGELNFTPTVEAGTIEKVEVSNDKGISWTTLDSVDGKYTAKIISGNNILKVTTDSGVSYQVVRGDRLTYTIEETTAAETNNNDNDGLIEAGETVRVTVQGLHSPIPKMAGNYNPGYAQNSDGYSKHHMSYILNGERIAGAGSQYNWISDTNYIDVTLPEEEGTYRLTDGCIGVGVIGIDNFIDGENSHRNIPDSGCTTRGSKTTFHTRSVLPEIEIYAQEKDHEHIYSKEWKYDETNHWKECRCEDKTEEAEHTFEWITDKEATTSEAGEEHEECTVCHVKRNENTEIPMLPIPTYTVTLKNGEGYQLNSVEDAELVVKEGGNFSFTVEIEEGYETSEGYKVKANEAELAETEGVYVIENITEDQVVTVEGVLKHEHIYSEEWKYDETNHWKECRCEDKTEEAEHTYEWVTDKEATTSEAGEKHEECTVCHAKRNENTEIPMLPIPTYTVTLQNGEGYQLNSVEGSELVVKEGGNFSFTVEIEEGYETSEGYKVKANEAELAETEGTYVIENITEDQVVTVEGVLKHEHIYSEEWKYDETNHWKECRCEDKTEEAEHTYEWVTDKEATTSEAGEKHEECTVCHVKRNENTEIPMLPAPEWEIKEVYLSISSDADYVVSKETKDVMAMKKVTVPYFDLADYGLEKFANEEGKVTVLHLLIYATEVYYCGVSEEEAGQGYLYEAGLLGTEVLSIGGKPGSLFFTNFWDLDMNMNYYVNYEYPLAYDDWGATAEQILLQDGDIVTFGRFKSWSFYEDSTSVFNYMKAGDEVVTTTAKQGDKVLLSLYHAGADMNGEKTTAHTPVYTCPDVYGTNVNDLESGVVKTWTNLGKADAQGNIIIDTKDFEPGEYLIAIEGQYGAEHKKDICSTPGGILLTVTENEDVPVTPPENPEVNEVVRISGATRYETGYKVADALKEKLGVEKFEAVVVATGKNFADALAGSYLAVEKNAPIILTNGKDDNIATLHTYIKDNVAAGGKVYILGGEAAVPAAAAAIDGYDVVRLSGKSRYETNLAILAEAGVAGDSIIVATGKTFADSLSASAVKLPILLVKPGEGLSEDAKAIVTGMKNIYIIGGEGAVSAEIAAELAAFGEVTRVSGKSRYETSVAVAKTFFENVDMAVIASAKDFPDGLCGGPFAAAMNTPLVLTADDKSEAAKIYMEENEIKAGYVLGGTAKITEDCVENIFGISY